MPLVPTTDPLRTLPPGTWPRVYRPTTARRIVVGLFGAAMAIGGLVVLALPFLRPMGPAGLLVVLFGGTLSAFGIHAVASMTVWRIVLQPDRLELFLPFRSSRLVRRDEVSGGRFSWGPSGEVRLKLERRQPAKGPVEIPLPCAVDGVFDAWFHGVPNLDAQDRARVVAALLADPTLGRNEDERRRALNRARRLGLAVLGAGLAVSGWGLAYPRPYAIAVTVLAVFPVAVLAVVLMGRGRFRLETDRHDPRPGLAPIVLLPGMVLGIRGILDMNLVEGWALLPWAGLAGLGFTMLISAAEVKRWKWWWILVATPMFSFYPWGALVQADVLLDRGAGELHRVPILEKRKMTTYYLDLPPWGPVSLRSSIQVPRHIYDQLQPGGSACITLHHGALGVRWLAADACR